MKTQILLMGAFACSVLAAVSAYAGPVEDFAAAYKEGKPLSAEAAYRKITKDGVKVAPIVHYQAAQVAEWSGQGTLRRDRLNLFVREEKGWTPEVEKSLWYLTRSGDDIDQFVRLADNVKADSVLWGFGSRMMKGFIDAKRFQKVLQMTDVLLARFKAKDRVDWVFNRLWECYAYNRETFPMADLKPLFAKYPLVDQYYWRQIVWDNWNTFGPLWVLEVSAKNKVYPNDLLIRSMESIDNDTYSKTTNKVEKAKIEEIAKAMKAGEGVWLGSKNFGVPAAYYMTTLRHPKFFYADVTTNGQSVAAQQLFEKVLKCPFHKNADRWCNDRVWQMISRSFDWKRWTPAANTAFVEAHPDRVPVDWLGYYSSLGNVYQKGDKEQSLKPIEQLCQKFPKQADAIRRNCIGRYARFGEKGRVEQFVVQTIGDSVVSFDAWWVLSVLNDCKGMTLGDKINVLKKGFAVSGWNNGWVEMEKAVKNNRNWELPKSKEYADFIAGLNKTAAAQDPLRRAAWQMSQAKDAAAAEKIMAEAVKQYPSRLPDPKCGRQNGPFNSAVWRYVELVRNGKPEESQKFCELVLPKLGVDYSEWGWIDNLVRRANSAATWQKYYETRRDVFGENDALSNMYVDRNAEKPYAIDMKPFSPWRNWEYARENYNRLKDGPARWQFVCDYVTARPVCENSVEAVNWMCDQLVGIARQEGWAAKVPLKALADAVFAEKATKWNGTALGVVRVGAAAGRLAEVLKPFMNRADAMELPSRVSLYTELLQMSWYTQKTGWVSVLCDRTDAEKKTQDAWGPILASKLTPALLAVEDRKAGMCSANFNGVLERIRSYYDWNNHKDHKDEKAVANVNAFYDAFVQAAMRGMNRDTEWYREGPAWAIAYGKAVAASNAVMMAKTARNVSSRSNYWVGNDWMYRLMSQTKATGFAEPFFILVNSLPGDANGDLLAQANKYRAEISSKIPGIYPVGENDPAYPLYVAADELARKNPERAWQLLQDPKNQTVFEREALKLPPDFVIWGVEQLRMARGEKDALLLRARHIATMILAQESKVSPETAAAMVLSRAEGYRDQQNFEAAKLEYQSIRNNPAYHATKYGKKAMFRATDLQIASGNAQAVESTLEYWLSQNDREVQAEAHYFQALIAFDRKDYDECIKQLRQVFSINYTHTEGRFLHGQWKLATNSEVDDTDVLVGDLTERNLIRPGNELTVTVQDANLSVAGGGASIPVVVRTTPGNDEERINLYPTSRDPSNFKGLVAVQLGKANPSNRVVEVSGNDIVSYVIDPDFLKERGLPLNEPKRLRVIDDGKLAIGAGAPRAEEKKTEKGVKDLLEDESNMADSGVSTRLRPGNPLYVVVQDRDRSLGGERDTVKVSVETSSGDRLRNFELTEEKPFSGVFRGKVETSLPPPRAFAHDTAVGLNPGDVINKNKSGGWKSLPDSQPGKWFEVDTMASYLFSEISMDMTGVDDVKTIKLVGRMGSKVMQLGQLPAATEMSKLYLRRQQQYDRSPRRSLGELRAFCQTSRAAKRTIVEKIEYRALGNGRDWQTALYAGPFMAPEGLGSLRLRLQPVSAKKDSLRTLWVAIALDGDEIYSGQGSKLQNALISTDIAPGCHTFEMAVVSQTHDDDFDLSLEPFGEEPKPFPAEWFSEEKHPELKDFVKDQVQIVKGPNGFKAVFNKPVRLRSFRWEFADVRSPAVAISRITAKDEKGETVLPVESDFSDSQNNSTLEVAPGDSITVKYEDDRTTSGEKKVLQRQMRSSFNDATVRFIFEDTNEQGNIVAYDAYRFQPGDSLVVCVTDSDCDETDKADEISVEIKNSAGKTSVRKLVEYAPRWSGGPQSSYGMHSGIFYGILKTCHASDTNAPAKVLRVTNDDLLTVSYDDRENTDPGVPCIRTARIFAARPSTPELTLFDVRKTREIDKSPDAKVMLERIRRRPGNENVQVVYRDVLTAVPMAAEQASSTNPIPVNVSAGIIPIRVNDRARARYACSKIMIEAVAHSEIEKAAAEGRDPDKVTVALGLGASLAPFKLVKGDQSGKEALEAGTFNGLIRLSLGPIDPNIEVPENAPPLLCVTGSDLIDVSVLSEDGQPIMKRTLKLVSDGTIGLTDSSFSAERTSAHVGESFFVMVDDADRDATDEPDRIEATVLSSLTGRTRPMTLTETMPHSGIFTGRLRPVMFAPGETIPSVATGGVASANEVLTEERFAVNYGDQVIFKYVDKLTLPGTEKNVLMTTGTVFRGANGDIRMFSKRFTDRDTAVLVQFRLAECLFEQAKEHRKLKQPEKSAAAIDEGKFILEEALKNYPDSSHVVQGEFLLANLYQELATEAKDAEDMDKARPLYQEALSRFSQILGTWPEGEYAARSQYHKALCLEMLQDYSRASEEYVKMTYLYPESDLVGEATIRLATYYYTKEKRFDISGHIYKNFQQRFPHHNKAARALFMAGSCYIKQAETMTAEIEKRKAKKEEIPQGFEARIKGFYASAVKTFETLIEVYRDGEPKLRAQTLYWAGDVSVRNHDYQKAYQYLKRTVFEYPETEWARRARGLLLQEGRAFKDFE